jgi:hypothetical protein
MSCLSYKTLKEAAQPIVYENLTDQPVRISSSDQLRSHHTQGRLGAFPGQLVFCLLFSLSSLI